MPPKVAVYTTYQSDPYKVVAKLLEKVYSSGQRALVLCPDEKMATLDTTLWTYHPGSFLPHGMMTDAFPENQPILLADKSTKANNAAVLLIAGTTVPENVNEFEKIVWVVDGADTQAIALSEAWGRAYVGEVIYWRQTVDGQWQMA
jgi:DNA polymerase-3 subunit chi